MTSPDGITWTLRAAAANNSWVSVTYGNGLFVAVSWAEKGNITNRVMTSPDGITWTSRTAAADNYWTEVTYGNGLFVAVSTTDAGTSTNRVMTSPDGINWTSRTAVDSWNSVTYANGLFVAVSGNGQVMTSGEFKLTADTGAAAAKAKADADAAANSEAARKQKAQQELTEIFAIIPNIAELTLSLGELTKTIIMKNSVASGSTKKQPNKVTASELKQIQKLGKTLALKIAESNKGSVNEGAVASFAEGVRILYGK
jgi:DNA uptake protein ComE-like DNA-binding protein